MQGVGNGSHTQSSTPMHPAKEEKQILHCSWRHRGVSQRRQMLQLRFLATTQESHEVTRAFCSPGIVGGEPDSP